MLKTLFSLALISFLLSTARAHVRHTLNVTLSPESHSLHVTDEVELNRSLDQVSFTLNNSLEIKNIVGAQIIKQIPHNGHREITVSVTGNRFAIEYSGIINDPVIRDQSSGLISKNGIALFAESYWYPDFEQDLISFVMHIKLPAGWMSVSQGLQENIRDIQTWTENFPQKTIYLMANKYYKQELIVDGIKAVTYLLKDEPDLANKFLQSTQHYIAMYSDMIGQYPYKKFALVENFWETGYGMPSFTLLGPTVTRLPFIFYSSYPHEILHNWWGNSVYVDYENGNWCEGLTTYLADHFMQTMSGADAGYRQGALKKFSDFISENNDYPLREFIFKEDNRAEAIGYSKGMMFFHMLKVRFGDELFLESLKYFYKEFKFKTASFDDIRTSFETVTGENLEIFFNQWVELPGAPKIELSNVTYRDGIVNFRLSQSEAHLYELTIPVDLQTKDGVITQFLTLNKKSQPYSLAAADLKRIIIDPRFDLFRAVDSRESAPSLSLVFGAQDKVVIVTPTDEPRYEALAKEISKNFSNVKITTDVNPVAAKSVIILGESNKLISTLKSHPDYNFSNGLVIRDEPFSKFSAAFIATDNSGANVMYIQAQHGMEKRVAQKVIHYGKYSAIAFDGEVNKLKTQWGVYDSPLVFNF